MTEAGPAVSVELSYADLGVAFCEIAERRDEFAGMGVGVFRTGEINRKLSESLIDGLEVAY